VTQLYIKASKILNISHYDIITLLWRFTDKNADSAWCAWTVTNRIHGSTQVWSDYQISCLVLHMLQD